jgi:hypothetical protein
MTAKSVFYSYFPSLAELAAARSGQGARRFSGAA